MSTPSSGSPRNDEVVFDSSDSIIIFSEGIVDTTIRPRRPNIPREYPRPVLPPPEPPAPEQPPEGPPPDEPQS